MEISQGNFFFLLCLGDGWSGMSGRREVAGNGGRRVNIVQKMYILYINVKMTLIETIPGMGGRKDGGEL
jgi:hypothetical protein